jgi:hypothetical protein
VRWRLEKRAERDRNAQKMEIRKRARPKKLCWRELNYGAISTTSLFPGME